MSKVHPAYFCSCDDVESQQHCRDDDEYMNSPLKTEGLYDDSKLENVFLWACVRSTRKFCFWCSGCLHLPHSDLVKSYYLEREQNIISVFQKYKKGLLFLSNITGAAFFSTGSILGYGYAPQSCGLITCHFFQSIASLIGSIFFTLTPAITHFLNESEKGEGDSSLSWKSNLYIIGGIIYMLGAMSYIPFSFSSNTQHSLIAGATFYVIGSAVYTIAVVRDIFRARQLKDNCRMSVINFMIESWVSGLYLLGSFLFLMGSVFSYPTLFTPHIYAMFLTGSLCFIIGSISGFSAQLWRYAQRALQRERILRHRQALMASIRRTSVNLQQALITRSNSAPNLMHVARQLSFKKSNVGRQQSFATLKLSGESERSLSCAQSSDGGVARQPSFTTFSRIVRQLSFTSPISSEQSTVKPQVVTKSKLKPTQIAVQVCHSWNQKEADEDPNTDDSDARYMCDTAQP